MIVVVEIKELHAKTSFVPTIWIAGAVRGGAKCSSPHASLSAMLCASDNGLDDI